jgi:hypothetical protein
MEHSELDVDSQSDESSAWDWSDYVEVDTDNKFVDSASFDTVPTDTFLAVLQKQQEQINRQQEQMNRQQGQTNRLLEVFMQGMLARDAEQEAHNQALAAAASTYLNAKLSTTTKKRTFSAVEGSTLSTVNTWNDVVKQRKTRKTNDEEAMLPTTTKKQLFSGISAVEGSTVSTSNRKKKLQLRPDINTRDHRTDRSEVKLVKPNAQRGSAPTKSLEVSTSTDDRDFYATKRTSRNELKDGSIKTKRSGFDIG